MKIYNNKENEERIMTRTSQLDMFSFYRYQKKHQKNLIIIFFVISCIAVYCSCSNKDEITFTSLESKANIQLAPAPLATTALSKGIINIPTGTIKANPFVPYRDLDANKKVFDVPEYDLVEPPEKMNETSDAARIMDTMVSGILYDRFSPSAILNIEGNDYLVKKGDVINNYEIINIAQNSVTVKLGINVYRAGIGEILTEGTLNHNNVSNLNNKFGGKNNEF